MATNHRLPDFPPNGKSPDGRNFVPQDIHGYYQNPAYSPDSTQYTKPKASDLTRMGTNGKKYDYLGTGKAINLKKLKRPNVSQ